MKTCEKLAVVRRAGRSESRTRRSSCQRINRRRRSVDLSDLGDVERKEREASRSGSNTRHERKGFRGRRFQDQAQRSSLPICFSYIPFFFHLFVSSVLFLTERPSRQERFNYANLSVTSNAWSKCRAWDSFGTDSRANRTNRLQVVKKHGEKTGTMVSYARISHETGEIFIGWRKKNPRYVARWKVRAAGRNVKARATSREHRPPVGRGSDSLSGGVHEPRII